MKIKNKLICFVAGHSGGHIIPSLTRAQQLLEEKHADTILFFSTNAPLDKKIVSNHPAISKLVLLTVHSVPYHNKLLLPLFALRLTTAFFKSLYHLIKNRPEKIISMGGYISFPVCFAGWLLRIPIELYELNVEPGRAIQFLAPLAKKIWLIYRESISYLPADKCQLTEYPVRFSIKEKLISREQALAEINLSPLKKTIFVLGGSQGSLFLNTLIKQWFEHIEPELKNHVQVIHQTGEYDRTDWKNFYGQLKVSAIIFSYHEHLVPFYQSADLVISRAGAGTLAELLFFQKKSLVIPLETKITNHQIYNAEAFARKDSKLFSVIRQRDIEKQSAPALAKIQQLLGLH